MVIRCGLRHIEIYRVEMRIGKVVDPCNSSSIDKVTDRDLVRTIHILDRSRQDQDVRADPVPRFIASLAKG